MRFEKGMVSEKFVDDGNYSIGYVDGKPAQCYTVSEMVEGDDFFECFDGQTFGVNCQDEYIVKDGKWVENAEQEENPAISNACNCGSGEERMTCSAPFGWEYCG